MTSEVIDIGGRDPLDYAAVFALRDNPFDPREFEGVPRTALDSLYDNPLALDEHPELEPLFVPEAGPFAQHVDRYIEVMTGAGYRSGGPREAPAKSITFRIAGPRGSGKSTLANRMIAWFKDCFTDSEKDGGALRVIKRSLRPAKAGDTVSLLHEQSRDLAGRWCFLALDNVTRDHEELIKDVREEFKEEEVTLLLVQIYDNPADLRRPLPGEPKRTDFWTAGMTREHARALLAARVQTFRAADVVAQLQFQLDCYPFDQHTVADLAGDEGSVTLRMFNHILYEALSRELRCRTDADRLVRLSRADIACRLIDVLAVAGELNGLQRAA
jgi:hypothetical protein